MTERKYAMTKIAPGDWLLPSNDAETIWRIAVYQDGPSSGLDCFDRDRDFWGCWYWRDELDSSVPIDATDWDRWEFYAGLHNTRAEAMQTALRAAPHRLAAREEQA